MTNHEEAGSEKPQNSRLVTGLFLVVFMVSIFLVARLLSVFSGAIILALLIASLFYPLYEKLNRKFRERRFVAATMTTVIVAFVVLLPLASLLASLSAEAFNAYQRATTSEQPLTEQLVALWQSDHPVVGHIRHALSRLGIDISLETLRDKAARAGATAAGLLYTQLSGIASNVFRTLLHFALMIMVMFGVFSEGPRLKKYLFDLSPLPDHQEEMLVKRFSGISRAVFLGNGVASILQGFFGGVAFYLFGAGSGVLWGTAMALLAFLPIVGASVVFIPATFLLYLQGSPGMAVGFFLFNLVHVAIAEYGLKPRLIGGQVEMSSILVFLAILAGLALFGILGLFYGPLILTMFLTLADIYKNEYRRDLVAVTSPWRIAEQTTPIDLSAASIEALARRLRELSADLSSSTTSPATIDHDAMPNPATDDKKA